MLTSRPPLRRLARTNRPRSLDGRPTAPDRIHHFPDAARIHLPYHRHSLPQLAVQFALRAHFEVYSFDTTTFTTLLTFILDWIRLFNFCSIFSYSPAILAGLVALQA